jgi:hypothetical protein
MEEERGGGYGRNEVIYLVVLDEMEDEEEERDVDNN